MTVTLEVALSILLNLGAVIWFAAKMVARINAIDLKLAECQKQRDVYHSQIEQREKELLEGAIERSLALRELKVRQETMIKKSDDCVERCNTQYAKCRAEQNFNWIQVRDEMKEFRAEMRAQLGTIQKELTETTTRLDDLIEWKNKSNGKA